MLNHLEIQMFDFPYTIPEKNFSGTQKQADFLIDGEPLGRILGIWKDRPWFGATRFEAQEESVNSYVLELLGQKAPENQFCTNRLVLFGCHCGCDYCGIVACDIDRDGEYILWRNIVHSEDPDLYKSLSELRFGFTQYSDAILSYVSRKKLSA